MRTIFYFLIAIGLLSCGADRDVVIAVDQLPGSSPAFSKDAKGNTVLSWVRQVNDSSSEFCYAVYGKGGQFGRAVTVAGSGNIKPHSENLPKIIFKPSGEIMAIWGISSGDRRNKYSGKIVYAQSFDQGVSWSAPKALVTDTAGYDQRYFDVAVQRDGEVAIVWLDNRKGSDYEGSALYFSVTRGRDGFVNERRIAESCCQCCRTDLFIDSRDNMHVLYRGIIADSIRDMMHIRSIDGGRRFSQPERISEDNWVLRACPHTGPAITENMEGLHFAWYTGAGAGGSFYTMQRSGENSYGKRELVTYAGKHPQLAVRGNGDLGMVWDEMVKQGDKTVSIVGLQIRDASGNGVWEYQLTADTAVATYPVITALDEEHFGVAYCERKGKDQYIFFRRLDEGRMQEYKGVQQVAAVGKKVNSISCSH